MAWEEGIGTDSLQKNEMKMRPEELLAIEELVETMMTRIFQAVVAARTVTMKQD